MKQYLLSALLILPFIAWAQTPCTGGMANGFPCNNLDLQSQIPPSAMGAVIANDSWGWTDPDDGKEYAIIGLDDGTAFIDISDPTNAVYLGKLPTHTNPSGWRDIKVYSNHAFVVSEAGGHGMQVFDLTRLRNVTNPPVTFTEDAHYDAFGDAHNIVINEDSGYAYAVGSALFNGGPHFINIQDPTNPIGEGGYDGADYSHDAQVVTYSGPDSDYTGREILIGSNETQLIIVDVTDKANPVEISSTGYSDLDYTHQGWLTEDQRYFLLGDEGDEFVIGFNSRTIVFDFSDLDNPQPFFEYFGPNPSVDHNGYVKGDKFYLANYSSGMRVIDISDIDNQNMTEVAYFDTYPPDNNASFDGNWSVYPFFESGNIVISGDAGFTLVIDPAVLAAQEVSNSKFAVFPNPATENITITSDNEPLRQVQIFNVLGQQVMDVRFDESLSKELDISKLRSGVYIVKINNNTSKRLVVQ